MTNDEGKNSKILNSMNTQFTAKTRCGATAHFNRVQPCYEVDNGHGCEPFVLLGYIRQDEPEVWTASGCWRAGGEKHPLDLMLKG
jgi:hypothetical protein